MILRYSFDEIADILMGYAAQDAASQGVSVRDFRTFMKFHIDETRSAPGRPDCPYNIEVEVSFEKRAKTG